MYAQGQLEVDLESRVYHYSISISLIGAGRGGLEFQKWIYLKILIL